MTAISDREHELYRRPGGRRPRQRGDRNRGHDPQHRSPAPGTHGTLRIVAKLDGEQVIAADPIMGYMHRGYEKLAEVRTYPQVTT